MLARSLFWTALISPIAAPAQAPPMLVPAPIDARTSSAVIAGCAAHAAGKKQSHAIVVVDLGGRTVAALRMDRVSYGAFAFATAKAEAAAAWGFATSGMADGAREVFGFGDAPYVVTVPGGMPIWNADGTRRIGAVGVSGEDPADDVACAEAGIRAAGLRIARTG